MISFDYIVYNVLYRPQAMNHLQPPPTYQLLRYKVHPRRCGGVQLNAFVQHGSGEVDGRYLEMIYVWVIY